MKLQLIPIFILMLLITSCTSKPQDIETKSIKLFESDLLSNHPLNKPDTLITSNVMVTRVKHPYSRVITKYFKKRNLKTISYYYNNSNVLKEEITYCISNDLPIGISKRYDSMGIV